MSEIKLKGCRPIEEINIEYSQLCGKLGDLLHKKDLIETEITKSLKRQDELDLEAKSYHNQVNGTKPVAVPQEDKNSTILVEEEASIAQEATT